MVEKTYNNSTSLLENIFMHQAYSLFHQLASEMIEEYPNAEFEVKTKDSGSDDPALYISLIKIGPERRFFKRSHDTLARVRCANYRNDIHHQIQVECYNCDIENRLISKFEALCKKENNRGVHIWRRGYL